MTHQEIGSLVKNTKVLDYTLNRNREQSALFTSPEAILRRERWQAAHPTLFIAFKCMDGRLNLPFITEVPPGIIQPIRNLGGYFDLGWPLLRRIVTDLILASVREGHGAILLVTYHFSAGDTHRGCKGFNYDTEKAMRAADVLKAQAERMFGRGVAHVIKLGIETDGDALIFHGDGGEVLDMGKGALDKDSLWEMLHALYPDLGPQMLRDLFKLAQGNSNHVQGLRATPRNLEDMEHREQILGIGRGFDWLHEPNKALLIGPFSSDLRGSIEKAAGILLDNIKSGRIPESDGVVLMSSAEYPHDGDLRKAGAIEEARWKIAEVLETVQTRVPELLPYAKELAGVVSLQTRLFTPIDPKNPE